MGKKKVLKSKPTIFVVDRDKAVCDRIHRLVGSVDLKAKTFATAEEFLAEYNAVQLGCLVLEVRMPGMSGLELQAKLSKEGILLPVS